MRECNILIVDDEKGQREILKTIIQGEGYEVMTASNEREALKAIGEGVFDAILTDLKMPGGDGTHLLTNILKEMPNTSVVIMTAHGTIDSAVEAMKLGAFDYLTKPLERDELLVVLNKAVEKTKLLNENTRLREQLEDRFKIENIIGKDGKMQEVLKIIKKVSNSNSTVLIFGESGTGKELAAKAIHHNSPRRDKPFMDINCAAIPETLLESELFGYEKGAFTGASTRKMGLFESANGGTLFMDEIGDMGIGLQARLLRAIQEREIRRVGGKDNIKIDVRIISATNKNIEGEIKEGRFREDLYYRLNVIAFRIPPLRERMGDVPELVSFFISKYNKSLGKKINGISDNALNLLINYSWPGNVRQLESVIERAVLLTDGAVIETDTLPPEIFNKPIQIGKIDFDIPNDGISFEELEREVLLKAMRKSNWVIAKSAQLLGMSYRTLQYRLNKFGIKRES
ncbi:MAG: sigma-54-dependent Fis family transcriptional regulator [Nitrospinae bacterium]|nr:sigma-54-dependent Fis family transcriptional regulator [Nitrospinota bacterium]